MTPRVETFATGQSAFGAKPIFPWYASYCHNSHTVEQKSAVLPKNAPWYESFALNSHTVESK